MNPWNIARVVAPFVAMGTAYALFPSHIGRERLMAAGIAGLGSYILLTAVSSQSDNQLPPNSGSSSR